MRTKLKTAKGIKRRFKITRRGKVIATRSGRRHLMGSKSRKRKRQMRRPLTVSEGIAKQIRALAPYR